MRFQSSDTASVPIPGKAPGTAPYLTGAVLACTVAFGCTSAPRSIEIEQGPLYREIAELEDARETGGNELIRFLRHPDRDLRLRAATALGRMSFPEHGIEVTNALLAALADDDRRVRAEAAFGLGLRGDPAAGDALVELAVDRMRRDAIPRVRARAIEAASKLDRPDLRARILEGLRDEDSTVRLEAAQGAHRWSRDEPHAEEVDYALLDQLEWEGERDVIAMTLFSLQRRRAPAALEVFIERLDSRQPLERIWAARGLTGLEPDPRSLDALVKATRDTDWRVAYEATSGLGAYDLGAETATLLAATGHRSAHVRRAAWEALTRRLARIEGGAAPELVDFMVAWRTAFDEQEPRTDPSTSVRAAFGAALVHYQRLAGAGAPSTAAVQARLAADATSVEEWVAYAAALGESAKARGDDDPSATVAVLERLSRHADVRIAGTALAALGNLPGAASRTVLHAALEREDNGLRLAAILALREMPDELDIEPLGRVYDAAEGDIGPEVRFNALVNLGAIGGQPARVLLVEGLIDEDPWVRHVAREQLESNWPGARLAEASLAIPEPEAAEVPWPGQDHPVYRRNPKVKVETTKGSMTFELFPREAPIHVHNFLTLAERDHYDGTLFHRVVPDFVIQGGDYRGDGNGGTTYRGVDSLRHEIGPRKYVRGSLGMPRNENPDSGGSQIFVTHRPTPHLDGRYTIFGELREGFGVLDSIEVGDRILDVRRLSRR